MQANLLPEYLKRCKTPVSMEELNTILIKVGEKMKEVSEPTEVEREYIRSYAAGEKRKYHQFVWMADEYFPLSDLRKNFDVYFHRYPCTGVRFIYKGVRTPKKVIVDTLPIRLNIYDLTQHTKEERILFVQETISAKGRQEFSASRGILVEFSVFQLSKSKRMVHALIYPYRKPELDFTRLLTEVFGIPADRKETFPVYNHYGELISNRNEPSYANQEYWNRYLAGMPEELPVPGYIESLDNEGTSTLYFVLENDLVEMIQHFRLREGISIEALLLGVWGRLICRYYKKTETLLGAVRQGKVKQFCPVIAKGVEDAYYLLTEIDKHLNKSRNQVCDIDATSMVHDFMYLDKAEFFSDIHYEAYEDAKASCAIRYYDFGDRIGMHYTYENNHFIEPYIKRLHTMFLVTLKEIAGGTRRSVSTTQSSAGMSSTEARVLIEKSKQQYMDATGLFDGISEMERRQIATHAMWKSFAMNDILLREKNAAVDVFIIGDGVVEVSATAMDGLEKSICVLKAGSILGLECLLSENMVAATYSAYTRSVQALVFGRSYFMKLMEMYPFITNRLLEAQIESVHKLQRMFISLQ